jgi:heme exporter protein A
LSAGQKRRLALSRLALVPRLIWLLDEPTVGLDQGSREQLFNIMRAQLRAGGLILVATHVPLGIAPDISVRLGDAQ